MKGIKGNCWNCGVQGHTKDNCPKGQSKGSYSFKGGKGKGVNYIESYEGTAAEDSWPPAEWSLNKQSENPEKSIGSLGQSSRVINLCSVGDFQSPKKIVKDIRAFRRFCFRL